MKLIKKLKIFKNEEKSIKHLMSKGILGERKRCWKCKSTLKINIQDKLKKCPKKNCRKTFGLFEKTFFENSKIKINNLLLFAYLYLCKTPVDGLKMATGLSSASIVEWSSFIRQVISEDIEEMHIKIGGENIIVEVDETKLGKRKYHRGHRIDGVWVVAGIERTTERKCFVVYVESRNEDTIRNILEKYVLPGSVVHTDGWKAYKTPCRDLFKKHLVVNHSK